MATTMAISLPVIGLPAGTVLWMALYAPMRWRSEAVGHALIVWAALAWIVSCGAAVLTAVAAVRAVRGRHQAA